MTEVLGIPSGNIDTDSFTNARDQVKTEELGVNFKLDVSSSVRSKIKSILDYISGVIYWDASNAKYVIGLKRDSNYGSPAETINSVKKTYTSNTASEFTVDYGSYDSLYTDLILKYDIQEYNEDPQTFNIQRSNPVSRDVLSYRKVKQISNEFIATVKGAQFYMAVQQNKYLRNEAKVRFKVATTDLNTIFIGCLVAYSDTNYDVNFDRIRVTRISGFNEFNSTVTVEGHAEYSISPDNSIDIEPGATFTLADQAQITNLEFVPEFADPMINGSFIPRNRAMALASAKNTLKSTGGFAKTKDENTGRLSGDQPIGYCVHGVLAGQYSHTGFIDKTGFSVTLSPTTNNIFDVDSKEFSFLALISRTVEGVTSDFSLENSDYEMVAFKKMQVTTQPTESSTGTAVISNVARNILGANYYSGNPYTSGTTSNYTAGETDVTGQFKHSADATVWIFPQMRDLAASRIVYDPYFVESSSKFNVTLQAKASDSKTNGQTVSTEYDYYDSSFSTTLANSQGNNKPPYRVKLEYPLPPAKVYGYSARVSSSHYFYFIYWAAANNRSGASWRSPGIVTPQSNVDNLVVIDYELAVENPTARASIVVSPEEKFQDAYQNKGQLSTSSTNENYLSGYFSLDDAYAYNLNSTAGNAIYKYNSVDAISVFNTVPIASGTNQNRNDLLITDVQIDKPIMGYGGFWLYTTLTSDLRFYIRHARQSAPEVTSEPRIIELAAQGSDTVGTLVIV